MIQCVSFSFFSRLCDNIECKSNLFLKDNYIRLYHKNGDNGGWWTTAAMFRGREREWRDMEKNLSKQFVSLLSSFRFEGQ